GRTVLGHGDLLRGLGQALPGDAHAVRAGGEAALHQPPAAGVGDAQRLVVEVHERARRLREDDQRGRLPRRGAGDGGGGGRHQRARLDGGAAGGHADDERRVRGALLAERHRIVAGGQLDLQRRQAQPAVAHERGGPRRVRAQVEGAGGGGTWSGGGG